MIYSHSFHIGYKIIIFFSGIESNNRFNINNPVYESGVYESLDKVNTIAENIAKFISEVENTPIRIIGTTTYWIVTNDISVMVIWNYVNFID